MEAPKLHALIYVWSEHGCKLAIVGKLGNKHMHLVQMHPDIRVTRQPMTGARWVDCPANEAPTRPGRTYRRLGRQHGITKAAKTMLRGVA